MYYKSPTSVETCLVQSICAPKLSRCAVGASGLLLSLTLLGGCEASLQSQIGSLEEPEALATQIFSSIDTNSDGKLDKQELSSSPGLAAGVQRIDSDRNDHITREELVKRLQTLATLSDFVGVQITVQRGGRPLPKATVTLEPASFMAAELQSYIGETDDRGNCHLRGQDIRVPGIPTGYYTAHIAQAATNTNVTLGCEIADDASGSRLVLKIEE